MKEPAQWEMLCRTNSPSRGVLLLIAAAVVSPTRSYFLEEIRFWLVVVAALVGLGVLLLVTFILLREGSHRGLCWMKVHVGKTAGARHAWLIVRSVMPRHLPHH